MSIFVRVRVTLLDPPFWRGRFVLTDWQVVELEIQLDEMKEQYNNVIRNSNSKQQQKKMAFLERNLEQLTLVQKQVRTPPAAKETLHACSITGMARGKGCVREAELR